MQDHIEVHMDPIGSKVVNKPLLRHRAEAARTWLTTKAGFYKVKSARNPSRLNKNVDESDDRRAEPRGHDG
jgi:hypothetical protein